MSSGDHRRFNCPLFEVEVTSEGRAGTRTARVTIGASIIVVVSLLAGNGILGSHPIVDGLKAVVKVLLDLFR